jgi:hypothetical protein
MTRVAFVSFANTPAYQNLQKALVFSVKRFGYDIFSYSSFEEIGSPDHTTSPYEFKIHAIRAVYMKGYDIVIWCDSPLRLVRNIQSWIPEIEKRGVYLQSDSHPLGSWANDNALKHFNLTRDEAMKLKTVYACVMAFDFRNPITREFLNRMKDCADRGLFKGKWKNNELTESQDPRCEGHRHDQTCAELVAREMNIQTAPRVLLSSPDPSRYFRSHWHT